VASLFLSTLLIGGPAIVFCIRIYLNAKKTGQYLWYLVLIVGSILTVLVSFFFPYLPIMMSVSKTMHAQSQSRVVVDSILTVGMLHDIFTSALVIQKAHEF
jgi:hypothetical protein